MKIENQLRLLQVYTGFLTIVLAVVLLSGFQSTQHQKMQELDVQRINIVEPDGKLRLTISNKERFPDPVIGGKALVGARHGNKEAGFLFFNDDGDECGGLGFSGKEVDGSPRAGASMMFDQYHQDQTVGIEYSQSGTQRSAGFHVWDRSDTALATLYPRMQALRNMPNGPEKQAQLEKMMTAGELGAHRLFVGKREDGSVGMIVADRLGKSRISLVVDKNNQGHLQFLDPSGNIVYSIPPEPVK